MINLAYVDKSLHIESSDNTKKKKKKIKNKIKNKKEKIIIKKSLIYTRRYLEPISEPARMLHRCTIKLTLLFLFI